MALQFVRTPLESLIYINSFGDDPKLIERGNAPTKCAEIMIDLWTMVKQFEGCGKVPLPKNVYTAVIAWYKAGGMERKLFQILMILFRTIGRIPRPTARRLGDALGRFLFLADKKHRTIVINNLTHALGKEKTEAERYHIAVRVFKNLGQILFEIGWSLRLSHEDFSSYFHITGLSHYRNAFNKKKGVLLLTGHIGNWELLSIIGAMTGFSANIVYRPLDFRPLDRFLCQTRTRFGAKLIVTAHSMRKIMTALRQGEAVVLLMDQNVDWYNGVFVDFFGRRACTNEGLALLALKTGAPVLPVFLVREDSFFRAEFGPEIPLIKTGDKIRDVEDNTQQYNNVIEAFIRRYPDQWFWVHQRWKTRPYHPWPKEK